MSTPAGGPSGPNVPPPPGGSFGQTQPPSGQFGQGQPGQGYGGGPGGPAGPGGPGQPYGMSGGPGEPPKKSRSKGLIAAIAGVIALVVVLCCIGGFVIANRDDDESSSSTTTSESTSESSTESSTTEPTSETTSEPTTSSTSEPTSETSSSSTAGGGTAEFPEEFDGWKRGTTSDNSGQQTAVYTKGSDTISVVIGEGVKPADFEAIWDGDEKVGDNHCGKLSSTTQCAGEAGGTTYLVTSATSKSASEVSGILDQLLKAV
ncbi:hypothetical protein NMQ01_14610 [Janibacter sp. CX7]|uniref:hypothetical protein n=1 Tax=Janibacter sp. CX7 TaxID=2963431 RepID=UPI0020CD1CA8|nr:hypothetical protein [Janibacter sp. CX7]UTT65910.1 hypothetical protein NMQ01_14610 [Janibacter sp. CX7]